MYKCKDCYQTFDDNEPCRTPNKVPYGLGQVTESYTLSCPYCSSENIIHRDDMECCASCGELFDPEDMHYDEDNDEWLCTDCYSQKFDKL